MGTLGTVQTPAITRTNLMWDPYNNVTTPDVNFGGRNRWSPFTGMWTAIKPDADNPYSPTLATTLRLANPADLGCKILWLDEAGIKIGDRLVIGAELMAASGTGRVIVKTYTAAGDEVVACTATSPTLTFDGTVQTFDVPPLIMAATVAYMRVVVDRISGTADINMYSMWVYRDMQTWPIASPSPLTPIGDDQLLNPTAEFGASVDLYGQAYLRDWQAQIAQIQNAVSGEQAVIAFLGDSWVSLDEIGAFARDALQTEHGDAGAGWVGIGSSFGAPTVSGTTYARVGTWTDTDEAAGSLGPDLADATSTDTATPAKVTVVSVATSFIIHYIMQDGGGSFRWRIDAGSWTTVPTDDPTTAHATETVSGLSSASHTLEIEVSVAGTAGVTLLGVDCQISGNGVRLHRIGNGGSESGNWIAVDATIWEAAITALAPNLVMILLGTNDEGSDVVPATFYTNMETLVGRVQTAMPLADIVLVVPGVNGRDPAGTYTIPDYATELRALAVAEGVACVDLSVLLNNWDNASARGLWQAAGSNHLSSVAGSQLAANRILKLLEV